MRGIMRMVLGLACRRRMRAMMCAAALGLAVEIGRQQGLVTWMRVEFSVAIVMC
jgi:hypothetical protein